LTSDQALMLLAALAASFIAALYLWSAGRPRR
jgi:hypothetical protein